MRIHSITFSDTVRQWQFKTIEFNRLTLLVGASGVGKTQILQSIMNLQRISKGKSLNGIRWKIEFSTVDGKKYLWEGEFENRGIDEEKIIRLGDDDQDEERNASKIIFERLMCDGLEIIVRDDKNITFEGTQTVKLPQQKSGIHLLKEEDAIANVYSGFQKITLSDFSGESKGKIISDDINIRTEQYPTIESIQTSDLSTRAKLYLASINVPHIFEQIKERFMDVFVFVEDMKVEPLVSNRVPALLRDMPFIHIKENGVDQRIEERYLSSGIYRTLIQIGELYLSTNGTITLIDEFENSLGINCINEVTGDLLTHKRDLQFIITSHHPYIINSINYNNWKLVTRKAGVVTTHNASDFNLGKSKHEAFAQLINLDAYLEGPQA